LLAVAGAVGLTACGTTFRLPILTDDGGADAGIGPEAAPPFDAEAREADGAAAAIEASDGPPETSTVDARTDVEGAACTRCPAYGAVAQVGPIPSILPELSGLAASKRHPGILYAHNDSGDTARFFAINSTAELQAEIDLASTVATDWEDIDVGPCPSGSCVYLGDIGDNNLKRSEYVIYRVVEPETLPTDGSSLVSAHERFPFVYPDGPHNAETLLVHPVTGRVFVATKISGVPSTVYEMPLPLKPDEIVTMVKVSEVSLPALAGVVTGGSFHPCSDRLLLRTYFGLYEMFANGATSPESLFLADPLQVPAATEVQGEAVTYAFDGLGYYTASETPANAPASELSFVSCP
jgi:hypothetical protein